VDLQQLPELRIGVQRLFTIVQAECGVRGRWMHRRDDPATYMEIYEGVKDAARFETVLEREGEKLGVRRKVEVFTDALAGKPA
jgi:hypothetical protein